LNWIQKGKPVNSAPPMTMPQAIWQICASRGYDTPNLIEDLFNPKLQNLSHPFSLDDMTVAVDRAILALKNNEAIGLYADYDLDGSPGLALLLDGLKKLGFEKLYSAQPSRMRDGYGFHKHFVDQFIKNEVRLIITVDVGITDVETVDYANAKNIDVIITDHHLPKDITPKAFAIVNPNKGNEGSGLNHLCGTGVAFYFLLALKMELEKQGLLKTPVQMKDLLDLFALATITDMVPLIRENRILVKHGLMQLEHTHRPGLRRLLNELGFAGKKIRSQDVAFRIAPKLNALTRLDEGVTAFSVLNADDKNAKPLVEETLLINQRRVQLQEKAKAVVEDLLKQADTSQFVFLCSHEFHPGVISLIASDLMNRFQVPAFIGSVIDGERIVGSARSPHQGKHLQSVLEAVSSNLEKFGGHALAAGFEMHADQRAEMTEKLNGYFKNLNQDSEETNTLFSHYDLEISPNEMNDQLIKWLDAMGPYGIQFEAPIFLSSKMEIKKVQTLKGMYLKYTLTKDGYSFEAPWFKGAKSFPVGAKVDILFDPQMNDFRGQSRVQLLLHDMRHSD
jgi:single-stranded-DNA-specific exonuclease